MESLANPAEPDDLVLCLISGGGSALLSLPAPGISFEDKQAANRALLACGATISEINCVRRHLSAIKGGRLAAACHPAKIVTLLISDVPGDDPIDIASGPTVGDPTSCVDALAIIKRYGIEVPESVLALLNSGETESVKPDDMRLAGVQTIMVTNPQTALQAGAEVAQRADIPVHILGDSIEGEARDVAKVLAGITHQVVRHGQPFSAPCILLSGAKPLFPGTLTRAWAMGIHPAERLAQNDGHGFFEAIGDSIVTGPTLTNVNDFRAIFIAADEPSTSTDLSSSGQLARGCSDAPDFPQRKAESWLASAWDGLL